MRRLLREMQDPTAELEAELTTLETELEQAETRLAHAHPREEGRYRNIIARLHDMIDVINDIIVSKATSGAAGMSTGGHEFIIDARVLKGMNINEVRQVVRFLISEAKTAKHKKTEKVEKAKKTEKAKKKKIPMAKPSKNAKLEEQEQMWSGRRSTWYMPRLGDY